MPVKSSNSSVLVWPTRVEVDSALRRWAARNQASRPGLVRVGCFGSYVRGDWGVGSDLDLVAIVGDSALPFERRALDWDVTPLPVSADLLVYTQAEWDALAGSHTRFGRMLASEVRWMTGE
jgi:hypothetical protein